MIVKATEKDRDVFAALWAEFLRDSSKAGADVLPTPRNLNTFLRLFDAYQSGEIEGAVWIAENVGVTMVGEVSSPQLFDSAHGRIATGWGTYVREAHRGQGWSKKLRELMCRWAEKRGFDVIQGPIALTNENSLESCSKIGANVHSAVYVKVLGGK